MAEPQEQEFVSNPVSGEIELGDPDSVDMQDSPLESEYPENPFDLEYEHSPSTKEDESETQETESKEETPGFLSRTIDFFTGGKPKSDPQLEARLNKLEQEKQEQEKKSKQISLEAGLRNELRDTLAEVFELDAEEDKQRLDKLAGVIEKVSKSHAENLTKETKEEFESRTKAEKEVNESVNRETKEVGMFYNGQEGRPNVDQMAPYVDYMLRRFQTKEGQPMLTAELTIPQLFKLSELAPFINALDQKYSDKVKGFNLQQVVNAADRMYGEWYKSAQKMFPDHKFTGYEHMDENFVKRVNGEEVEPRERKKARAVEMSGAMVTDELETEEREETLGRRKTKNAKQVVDDVLSKFVA